MNVHLDISGKVARLAINRPEKRNAASHAVLLAMRDHLLHLTGLATDGKVRGLILHSSTPGIFCAGADISEFAAMSGDPAWRTENQQALASVQYLLSRFPLPVIAAVDGDCVGAGCGLALACDMRVASPRARFGITPAKLGLAYPLHDTKLLVDLVGPAHAKRILFTAALFTAEDSVGMGLVEILADDPLAEASRIAETMASVSGHSIRHSKSMIRRILDGQHDDDDETRRNFHEAFDGDDFREGVAAFLEKRPAAFK